MNRDDKHAYFTHVKRTMEDQIQAHATRIAELEGDWHGLWQEEARELLRWHKENYARRLETLARADHWLSTNVHVPIDVLTQYTERLANVLLGEKLPLHVFEAGMHLVVAGDPITKNHLRDMVQAWANGTLWIDPSPIRNRVWETLWNLQPATA